MWGEPGGQWEWVEGGSGERGIRGSVGVGRSERREEMC